MIVLICLAIMVYWLYCLTHQSYEEYLELREEVDEIW